MPEVNVVIEPVFRPVPLAGSQVEPLPAPDTPHSVSTAILPEAAIPTLNAGRVAISVLVEGDPTSLIERLPAPVGWHLKEPRLTQMGSSTRLSVELVPVAQATGPTMEAGR